MSSRSTVGVMISTAEAVLSSPVELAMIIEERRQLEGRLPSISSLKWCGLAIE